MSANISKLTPTSLAALLCARICHDLISPVGALGTAIEILDDESNTDMHEDALELVRNSSKQATAKLKFLRLAFGAGGTAPGVIASHEIQELADNMFATSKPDLAWNLNTDGIDKDHTRILLNLIMLAVQAAPRGGVVTISRVENDGKIRFELVSEGNRARLDEAVARALFGKAPTDGFDGRSIQPFYTSMLTREAGGSVGAQAMDNKITFHAEFPIAAT